MYIQFDLITGQKVKSLSRIQAKLNQWTAQYGIDRFQLKVSKGSLRVTFDQDQLYSLFAVTWNPEQNFMFDYTLIEPMKTRQP